jgi:hypothetical protein
MTDGAHVVMVVVMVLIMMTTYGAGAATGRGIQRVFAREKVRKPATGRGIQRVFAREKVRKPIAAAAAIDARPRSSESWTY